MMPVLNKVAYYLNRRDEVPNQELARELVAAQDREGIREIADNLRHENPSVQSDCLKVLYEIGYLAPDLIADYVAPFLELLKYENNRMVWGSMIALATIAELRPNEIWAQIDAVVDAMQRGTLITVVWGVKTLAVVASTDRTRCERLFPILMNALRNCLPRDIPMHAESILRTVDASNKAEFLAVLESRKVEMTASQLARLRKVIRQVEAR